MATQVRQVRVGAPLMHAFRAANAAKDATKKLDLRDKGERVIAGRRATAGALVSEAVLRREVARDLETLLNTINLDAVQSLADLPDVADSILNFGIPDIVHRSIDEQGVDDIVAELEAAFRRFEPRLAGRSIKVRRDRKVGAEELKVRFFVAAEIVMSPENVPVEFVADVEVDSGKFVLSRV